MRKAQFLFDGTAEGKQTGFSARRRDDLDPERQLVFFPPHRQGQDREADQRDDEGDGEIVDRCLQRRAVDRSDIADLVRPGEDGGRRRDQEIGAGEQLAKAATDRGAPPLGVEIILGGKLCARLDVPDHGRCQLGAARSQQFAIAVGDMRRAQRAEGFDRAAAIGRGRYDNGNSRERIAGGGKTRTDTTRNRRDAEIGGDSDLGTFPERPIITDDASRERIVRIAPSAHRQRQFEILDTAGEEAVGGQHVPAERSARRRDAARRGPDRGDIAKACGRAHRAAEIGALRERHHAGRDRDGGAAGRSTGRQREIGRIARRPAHLIGADRTEAELGRVGLSQDDRAGAPQPRHHEIVLGRHMIAKQDRSICCPQSRGVGEILDPDGHAMQRTDRRRSCIADVRGAAGAPGIDDHERRQQRILFRDPRQMCLDGIARAQLARSDGARKGFGSEIADRWLRCHRRTMPNLAAKGERGGHETCFLPRKNRRQHHG